jgi:hypothetical protein
MVNCKIDGVKEAFKVDYLKNVLLKNVIVNGKEIKSFD